MFREFLKFNLKKIWFVYVALCFLEMIGIMLGEPQYSYVIDVSGLVIQLSVLTLIPNIVYVIKKRKESGAFSGFLGMVPLIPIPYAVFAVILTIVFH